MTASHEEELTRGCSSVAPAWRPSACPVASSALIPRHCPCQMEKVSGVKRLAYDTRDDGGSVFGRRLWKDDSRSAAAPRRCMRMTMVYRVLWILQDSDGACCDPEDLWKPSAPPVVPDVQCGKLCLDASSHRAALQMRAVAVSSSTV